MNIENLLIVCSFMFCLSVGANDPLDLRNDYKFEGVNLKCAKLKDGEGWIPDIEEVYKKVTDSSDLCWEAVKSLLDELNDIQPIFQDEVKKNEEVELATIEKIYKIASSLKRLAIRFPDKECDTLCAMGYSLIFRLLGANSEDALWYLQDNCLTRDCLKYVQLAKEGKTLPDDDFFGIQRAFQHALGTASEDYFDPLYDYPGALNEESGNYSDALSRTEVQRIVRESLQHVLGAVHSSAMEETAPRTEFMEEDNGIVLQSPPESSRPADFEDVHNRKRQLDGYPSAKRSTSPTGSETVSVVAY